MIPDRVLEFANSKGLFDCGVIIVGLSGGPDSVALLCILKKLKDENRIDPDILAFHCNHHLRPGVCDEEAAMVTRLCADLGIGLKVIDFDCARFAKQNHISEETAGRILRYEAFEQYAQAIGESTGKTVRIAIAHHKDDIAETMMMNLFRGTGLEGLVSPKSLSGRLIRPLICLKKSELIDYLESGGISYATDLTNLEPSGTRNVWRNDLLPRIGEYYNEDPSMPLVRTYKLLSDDLDFIAKVTAESYAASRKVLAGHPALRVPETSALHPAVKSRVVRLLWQETFGDLIDFEESNLKDCFDLMESGASGEVTLDMPFGRKAYRHGDVFCFTAADGVKGIGTAIAEDMGYVVSKGALSLDLDINGIPENGEYRSEIPHSSLILKVRIIENKDDLEYNNLLWFCPISALDGGKITIGNTEGVGNAFRMRRAGSSGSKDISRLMTDLKIPESARGRIIFMANGGDILWLPGFGHGVGFTNAASREKYIANNRSEDHKSDALLMFTIERQ
jgi:tRNA(Ile)-lysidine synthase